jgi:hypothetical protein
MNSRKKNKIILGQNQRDFFFDQQVLIAKQTYQIQKLDYRIFSTSTS